MAISTVSKVKVAAPFSFLRRCVLETQVKLNIDVKLNAAEIKTVGNTIRQCSTNGKVDLFLFESKVGKNNNALIQAAMKNYASKYTTNDYLKYQTEQKRNDDKLIGSLAKEMSKESSSLEKDVAEIKEPVKLLFPAQKSDISHLTAEFKEMDPVTVRNKIALECAVDVLNKHSEFKIDNYQHMVKNQSTWCVGSGSLRSMVTALQGISSFEQKINTSNEALKLHGKEAKLILQTEIPLNNGNMLCFSQFGTPAAVGSKLNDFLTHPLPENEKNLAIDALNGCLFRMNALRCDMQKIEKALPEAEAEPSFAVLHPESGYMNVLTSHEKIAFAFASASLVSLCKENSIAGIGYKDK